MTYWIYSPDAANADYLRSVGVTLGTRKGDYWHDCLITPEAEDDMNEHWGQLMWGFEIEPPRLSGMTKASDVRWKCLHCNCYMREDGTCSYPLCIPKALGRKARLRK